MPGEGIRRRKGIGHKESRDPQLSCFFVFDTSDQVASQIAISSGPQAQSHACKAGWPCIGDVLVTILNLCALVRVSGRRMSRRRMRAADKAAIEPAWTSMGYSECSNNHFDISEQICLL